MVIFLIAIFALLMLSALFSGSETALTAVSRPLIHAMEKGGDTRARMIRRLLDKRERLIGSILLGNNLVNILASALATGAMIEIFGEPGVVYATLVMTVLVLIFAEILPKTLALTHTMTVARAVAPVMRLIVWLLAPVVSVIQVVVRVTLRLFGAGTNTAKTAATTLAELRGAIDLHTREIAAYSGGISHERAMLRSVLDLSNVEVSEIMIHRRNVVSIDVDQPTAKIVDQALESAYTRIPLYRGKPENIVGVLHSKALLRATRGSDGPPLEDLDVLKVAAPPWFIPDSTRLLNQLHAFRARHNHFALVVDEYGDLQGVVTLEDILEEIVGDISDEHDIATAGLQPEADGGYVMDGDVTLRDLTRLLDWEPPDSEAATIAGLLLHETRSIPEVGRIFRFHNLQFEVLHRQRNRIVTVKVTPLRELPEKANACPTDNQ